MRYRGRSDRDERPGAGTGANHRRECGGDSGGVRMATWPLMRMDALCEITSSKCIFAADYVSEGVPFYRGREITEKYKGNLDVSTELFITEEKFREIERKFGAPKFGDLLLTSVGTLGSVYVVKPGDRFYLLGWKPDLVPSLQGTRQPVFVLLDRLTSRQSGTREMHDWIIPVGCHHRALKEHGN